MAQIPTPDLAVPYAAPKQVKTMADVQPIAPKNGYILRQYWSHVVMRWQMGDPLVSRWASNYTDRIDRAR